MKPKVILRSFAVFLFFALVVSVTTAQAQTDTTTTELNKANTQEDKMPEYKAGTAALIKFMYKNIKRPKDGRKNGTVKVSFIVHEDGSLSDYQLVESLEPALDEEAIRVVKLTDGNWKPGMQNGNPVKVRFTLPLMFKQSF